MTLGFARIGIPYPDLMGPFVGVVETRISGATPWGPHLGGHLAPNERLTMRCWRPRRARGPSGAERSGDGDSRAHLGLNKGEARHALARAVYFGVPPARLRFYTVAYCTPC